MVIKERIFRNEDGEEVIIKICSSKSGPCLIIFKSEKVMHKLTAGSNAYLVFNYNGFKITVDYYVFQDYIVEEERINDYLVERNVYL